MNMEEIKKVKPIKYDDAETKKPGLPIETPYKYADTRYIKVVDKDNKDM
jgi:hypothetical protein